MRRVISAKTASRAGCDSSARRALGLANRGKLARMPDFEVGPEGRAPVTSPFRRLTSVLLGVLGLPFGFAISSIIPSCMGFGDPALVIANQCTAATSVLGTPITQSFVGISCGNAETEDDDGNASWSFPVSGPRGRGTLDVQGIERSGRWQFGSLVLNAGGRSIDLVACASGGTGDLVAVTHREQHGTVSMIVGEPGVATGAACIVTVDPSDGAQSCRVSVVCGERTLYGGGTQGYGHCAMDAAGAISMRDGNPSSVDGDPMIDLRLGAHEVVLDDQNASGTWLVRIATTD
jgi:hypothetical protein